jgi:hypothetical protein
MIDTVNINNDTDTVLKLTKHLILCIDKLKILRYGINVHEITIQQNSKIQNLIHRERRAVSNKGTMSTTLRSVHGPRPDKINIASNSTSDQEMPSKIHHFKQITKGDSDKQRVKLVL